MKLPTASLFLLACATASVHAQYFSEGWKPGQPVYEVTDAPPQATFASPPPTADAPARPPRKAGLAGLFDVTRLLTSEPVVALFEKVGINITDRVAGVLEAQKIWDERIPLITDDNFKELVVEEPLTAAEEEDRTWIVVISVTSAKQDGISKYMDEMFDAAFNQTQLVGDLPNVRWGRIDYLNVTYLTTKWSVWQAPYLMVLRDRGQSLRFYKPYQLRLQADSLREFLQAEDWRLTPEWRSIYGPGGEREYIMDFIAIWITKIYNLVVLVPRWLMFILSGSIASVVINFLHKPSKAPAAPPPSAKPSSAKVEAEAESTSTDTPASPSAKRGSAKQRKTKK